MCAFRNSLDGEVGVLPLPFPNAGFPITECEVDTFSGRNETLRFTTPVVDEKETRLPVDAVDDGFVLARYRERIGEGDDDEECGDCAER